MAQMDGMGWLVANERRLMLMHAVDGVEELASVKASIFKPHLIFTLFYKESFLFENTNMEIFFSIVWMDTASYWGDITKIL